MKFKLFFLMVLIGALILLINLIFTSFSGIWFYQSNSLFMKHFLVSDVRFEVKNNSIKYILQWTPGNTVPFIYMGKGLTGFTHCAYVNCYVTDNRTYFKDYTSFDVIAFSWPQMISRQWDIPKVRLPYQKYVFASIESPAYYPIHNSRFDGFFNWTWTYKLDSDMQWGYIAVTDMERNIIGPKINMQWLNIADMEPINDEVRISLKKKSKAAAWLVSNCRSRSKREQLVRDLQIELQKYNLTVDIFGDCGPLKCPRNNEECVRKIEDDYYFYLSFENSISEDYVTEKLITALQHNAVPIVYGGANYTRFMSDGIYLHAQILGAVKLAETMNRLIDNPSEYEQFFRWKNHYMYFRRQQLIETDAYCSMCALLNNNKKVKSNTVYENMIKWWK